MTAERTHTSTKGRVAVFALCCIALALLGYSSLGERKWTDVDVRIRSSLTGGETASERRDYTYSPFRTTFEGTDRNDETNGTTVEAFSEYFVTYSLFSCSPDPTEDAPPTDERAGALDGTIEDGPCRRLLATHASLLAALMFGVGAAAHALFVGHVRGGALLLVLATASFLASWAAFLSYSFSVRDERSNECVVLEDAAADTADVLSLTCDTRHTTAGGVVAMVVATAVLVAALLAAVIPRAPPSGDDAGGPVGGGGVALTEAAGRNQ